MRIVEIAFFSIHHSNTINSSKNRINYLKFPQNNHTITHKNTPPIAQTIRKYSQTKNKTLRIWPYMPVFIPTAPNCQYRHTDGGDQVGEGHRRKIETSIGGGAPGDAAPIPGAPINILNMCHFLRGVSAPLQPTAAPEGVSLARWLHWRGRLCCRDAICPVVSNDC